MSTSTECLEAADPYIRFQSLQRTVTRISLRMLIASMHVMNKLLMVARALNGHPVVLRLLQGRQPISSASNMSPPGGFSLERYYSARTLKFASLSCVMMESTGRPYKKWLTYAVVCGNDSERNFYIIKCSQIRASSVRFTICLLLEINVVVTACPVHTLWRRGPTTL